MTDHCDLSPSGNCCRLSANSTGATGSTATRPWRISGSAARGDPLLLPGMLQIAVALHHWQGGNFGGALLLLGSGADYLRRVRPVCQRIDVASLLAAAERCRAELESLGVERMFDLADEFIPRMRLAPATD